MHQVKVSDYVYERLSEVKSNKDHTSFDSAIRELLYGNQPSLWGEMAVKTKQRDNFECRRCGKSELEEFKDTGKQLAVHHLTPRSEFENEKDSHKLDNLVTLCGSCHTAVGANGFDLESINSYYEKYGE